MKFIIFKKETSIYIKLLISFVAIITSLILALSSLLYYNYTSSSIEMLKGMNVNTLSKISYSSVFMDNIAKRLSQSLSLNNPIIAFEYSTDQDILNISNAIRNLNALTFPNTFIQSAYIYNRKIDTFISTPSDNFYKSSEFYDQEILTLLQNSYKDLIPILHPIPREIANPEGTTQKFANVYTYILFDTTYSNRKNFTSAIILNVDADWLRLTISSLDKKVNSEGNEIFVVDNNGVIVSHSSPDKFMRNIADQNYIHKILASTESSGTFIDHFNNKKYVVSYVSSEILGWKYISTTPYETVFSSVRRNELITFAFCLIVLLLGLLFSFIISKKLYRPIGTLADGIKQQLKLGGTRGKHMDEVGFLASAFTGIMDKTTVLENMNRDNTNLLKNDFLKSLVMGQVFLSQEKIAAKARELHIHLNFENNMFLFIIKIDFYKDFIEKHNESDRLLLKYAIANIAKEVTSEHYRNEVIDTGSDQFTILVDLGEFQGNQGIYDTFQSIVTSIQNYAKQYLKISLSGTLGFVVESRENMNNMYEETVSLSMYRIKYGHFSLITPEIVKEVDEGYLRFPAAKEKQLIDSLMLGNGEHAKEAYREIIKSIEHNSYDNIVTSIIYLSYSIYNSLNRIVEGSQSKYNYMSMDFFNKVAGFETFEEIERTFFGLIDEIILLKDGSKDKKKNEIVNTVIDIINGNYQDKNLSLNSCAESLSINAVYLGKLFKNSIGKSVAEYITTVRMEKIKYYIEHTKMPINDILESCGIERSNYFYTTFKKYFGVSLTEYRLKDVKVNTENDAP